MKSTKVLKRLLPSQNSLAYLFDFEEKKKIIKANEDKISSDGFWNDQKNAQRIIQETNSLKNMIEEYQRIDKALVLLK